MLPPRGTRVLVVEDNEAARQSLVWLLSAQGCEVRAARDGAAGVREALQWRPDAVVSDIDLPGLDGWGLAEQVRSSLGEAVFLVALTAYAQPADRERSRLAGFDAHLAKPADVVLLLGLLAEGVRPLLA